MDADLLLQILNLIRPMSSRLQEAMLACIREQQLPKGHLLLKAGEVSRQIFFIKSGFARAFYHTPNGKECTSWFMGTGDIMIAVHSFYTQSASTESIELLEDSVVQTMHWTAVQAIYADFPEFNYHGRLLTEKYYIAAEQRQILLRTGTARERYDMLLATHPHILQKASLGDIASYLNVSYEALCRIRAKK